MIPLLLIAGGSFILADLIIKDANDVETVKLSLGDYLPEKSIEIGDEIVLHFKQDAWLELYEDDEYPTIEIPFQAGENFEVKVFDIDDYQYHVTMSDGSLAFIPKNEVVVDAINDEVASFRKGGKLKDVSKAKKNANKSKSTKK